MWCMRHSTGSGPRLRPKRAARRVSIVPAFFEQNLSFGGRQFDVVLLWTTLDYIPQGLVQPLIQHLHDGRTSGRTSSRPFSHQIHWARYHILPLPPDGRRHDRDAGVRDASCPACLHEPQHRKAVFALWQLSFLSGQRQHLRSHHYPLRSRPRRRALARRFLRRPESLLEWFRPSSSPPASLACEASVALRPSSYFLVTAATSSLIRFW